VQAKCRELGINAVISDVWAQGGEGGIALAEEVIKLCEQPNNFSFTYPLEMGIIEKIETIAKRVYRADSVSFDLKAEKQIKRLESQGYGNLPVCMAKTQFSFSDDPTLLGAPTGFRIHVTDVKPNSGAGFIVARTGDIMIMPGLPKRPSAENIDVDNDGHVTGLF
jgi:formate--tetrahydrofolate ligase